MKKISLISLSLFLITITAWADLPSSLSFTPYGLVHYRIKGRFNSQEDTAGNTQKQNLYSHQIAYYVGIKAQVNDKLLLQLQIGNDWVNTELVSYKTNNNWDSGKNLFPYFHLAFATWNPGPFNFTFGKIPVESFGPLDLLERSIATNTYGSGGPGFGASFLGWITGTNNSLIGLKLGVPILKEKANLSANVTYAIIDGDATLNTVRGETLSKDPKHNPSEQLIVLDVPFSSGNLTLTPQAFTVLNRNYNKNTEKGDVEYGAGISAGLKSKSGKVSLRAKGGFATYDNENTRKDFPVNDTTIRTLEKRDQIGFIGSIGSSVSIGPGIANIDFSISTDENTSSNGTLVKYPIIDAKYVWSPIKNFDIIPRVRAFFTRFDEASAIKSKTWVWPELIFQAKF